MSKASYVSKAFSAQAPSRALAGAGKWQRLAASRGRPRLREPSWATAWPFSFSDPPHGPSVSAAPVPRGGPGSLPAVHSPAPTASAPGAAYLPLRGCHQVSQPGSGPCHLFSLSRARSLGPCCVNRAQPWASVSRPVQGQASWLWQPIRSPHLRLPASRVWAIWKTTPQQEKALGFKTVLARQVLGSLPTPLLQHAVLCHVPHTRWGLTACIEAFGW